LPVPEETSPELEALYRATLELGARAMKLAQPEADVNVAQLAAQVRDPLHLAYLVGSMLSLAVPQEQALLEAPTRLQALQLVYSYLSHEVQVLELRRKITDQAQSEMGKEQRDYLLRQQKRAIEQELGEKTPEKAEVEEL